MEGARALGSRYELLELLGTGAMGQVWRARDARSSTFRAAKLLLESYAHDHEIVARFIQERSILMSLNHPNIVRVHDLVVEGDVLAIVMDLVEGPNLGTYLKSRGTLGTREAITATVAVLDALASAHAQGCLHRDVKPDNVLLDRFDNLRDEGVRLSDFSISRIAEEASIQSTGLLGTPAYMSPELVRDGVISTASDVYSTGVLLYELLAGRTPFAGAGTAYQVGDRHVKMAPPPLPVAPELWDVLAAMLSKDPARRRTALGTAAALRELPAHAVNAAPLPVQSEPTEWVLAPEPAPPAVDATRVSLGRRSEPGPHYSAAPTVSPVAGSIPPSAAVGASPVGSVPIPTGSSSSTPGGGHAAARTRTSVHPAWWVAGTVAVAAIAAVTVLLVAGGGADGGGGDTGGGAAVALDPVDDPVLPTGLTVERLATYDPSTHRVSLTTTYGAQQYPLGGSLLMVLPQGAGGDCPDPSWRGDTTPKAIAAGDRGIVAPCAYSVDFPGAIARQSSRRVVATWDDDLGGDARSALQKIVDDVPTLTTQALDTLQGSDDFAVQRLAALKVRVEGQVRVGHPIDLSVLPVWIGSGVDDNAIYSTEATSVTDVVTDVAGGADGVKLSSDCSAIRAVQGDHLVAFSADQGCAVSAAIGQVPAAHSPELSIVRVSD